MMFTIAWKENEKLGAGGRIKSRVVRPYRSNFLEEKIGLTFVHALVFQPFSRSEKCCPFLQDNEDAQCHCEYYLYDINKKKNKTVLLSSYLLQKYQSLKMLII